MVNFVYAKISLKITFFIKNKCSLYLKLIGEKSICEQMNTDLNDSEVLFSQSLIDGFNESLTDKSLDNSMRTNETFGEVESAATKEIMEKAMETVQSNDSTFFSEMAGTQIESKYGKK